MREAALSAIIARPHLVGAKKGVAGAQYRLSQVDMVKAANISEWDINSILTNSPLRCVTKERVVDHALCDILIKAVFNNYREYQANPTK